MRFKRRALVKGAVGSAGALALAGTLGRSDTGAVGSFAPSRRRSGPAYQESEKQIEIWNRNPDAAPVSGGEVRAEYLDFWAPSRTIWTQPAGVSGKRLVFSSLITHEDPQTLAIKAELAESWELTPDGTTATFHLRRGVTWHDGAPFTAKDVEFTLKAIVHKDTNSPLAAAFKLDKLAGAEEFATGAADAIAGVKVIDDYTIELTTTSPVGFLFYLTQVMITPVHILGEVPYAELDAHIYSQEPIGTGPFKFSRRVPDQFLELVRNDTYWNGAPYLERFICVSFQDSTSSLLAFENGDVDLALVFGPDLERVLKMQNTAVLGGATDFPNALTFNLAQPYLSDVRIRQGLLHAIDRQALKDGIMKQTVELTISALPYPKWAKTDLPEQYEYNPDLAKQLLAEGGWDSGRELRLNTYYSDQSAQNILAAIQQFWAAVGVKATPQALETATTYQKWNDGDFDTFYLGATGSSDPSLTSTFVGCNTTPAQGFTGFGSNFLGYCNPEVDTLFAEAAVTVDETARKAMYDQIQVILNQDVPYLPLWVPVRAAGAKANLINATFFQDYADGNYAQEFEKWFWAQQ
jgi:peptide/nickel transport system substrate-binding protein